MAPATLLVVPLAARWVRQQEAIILRSGAPLDSRQLEDARKAGVREPEKIRVALVDAIPVPHGALLGPLGRATGLINPNIAGITLGSGIYIRRKYRGERNLLVHECAHVGQYERLGSIEAFLRPYLRECLDPGYPSGPLEQEAIHRAAEIVPRG